MDKQPMKLLALIPAFAIAIAAPAHAQSNLQWRTTECQVQEGGKIIAKGPCQAGFAYDTAVRAIKYRDVTGIWIYNQFGDPGVSISTSDRECLNVSYNEGADQLYCTVKTPEQLGIVGD